MAVREPGQEALSYGIGFRQAGKRRALVEIVAEPAQTLYTNW